MKTYFQAVNSGLVTVRKRFVSDTSKTIVAKQILFGWYCGYVVTSILNADLSRWIAHSVGLINRTYL